MKGREVIFVDTLWGQACNLSHFILVVGSTYPHLFLIEEELGAIIKLIMVISVSDGGSTFGSKSHTM